MARIKHHGFNQTELDRAKHQISRGDEWWDQGDKLASSTYASWCLSHFLRDEPILNARLIRELNARLLPGIVLEDVNGIFGQRFSDATTVLLVTAPEKYRDTLPTAESVSEQFSQIEAREAGAISDVETDRPLLSQKPKPGSIVEEKTIPEIGVAEWTLSNGLKVVLRPSDWDRDRIFFNGFSPGGTSVCGDDEYEAVSVVSNLIRDCGAGDFDRRELRNKSLETIAHADPYVWETREGIDGKALARDVQTMFELLYLRFTSPLACGDAFREWQNSKREWIKNQNADPRFVFYDTLDAILSQNHPRRRHISTLEELEAVDLDTGYRVFRDRFSDASDFTFVFYGDFDVDELKPLILTYVGSLPSTGRKETWRDIGVRPPRGVVKKVIRKGIEPQAEVAIVFTGPFEWSGQSEIVLEAMGEALRERLRNTLREEMSGTYGAMVAASAGADPFSRRVPYSCYTVYIHFGSAPERCEELVNAVFVQIDSLKTFECDERTVSSIRETKRRYLEGYLKKNSYWGSELVRAYFEGDDPREIPKVLEYIRSIDAPGIREAARKYLDLGNYVQLIRMPEGEQKAESQAK